MNKILLLLSLFISTASHAAVTCATDSGDGKITMKITNPSEYYNGEVEVTGETITDYFSSDLRSVNPNCEFGYANRTCVFPARVDLNKKEFFNGGRYSWGFVGFSETKGVKILSTFSSRPTGRNWFFNYCFSHD